MVCEVVADILRETGRTRIVWGDDALFAAVAVRCGFEYEGTATAARILSALGDTPGELVKTFGLKGNRKVRAFEFPTVAAAMAALVAVMRGEGCVEWDTDGNCLSDWH